MRIGMRRYTQAVLGLLVIGGTSLVFQNCGGYMPNRVTGEAGLDSLCTGNACSTQPEAVLLAIGNADPERLITTDTAFDVGGYCDAGGYPGNRIYFQITGPTPSQMQAVNNGCDELGRFRLRVALPAAYNHNAIHILQVRLVGIDQSGREIENPLGLHSRQINLVTNTAPGT